jgi:hypothetical protein
MRTWTRLIPAVLLAMLFLGASLHAGDAETNDKKIEKLQTEMKQLREDVQKLKSEITIQNNLRDSRIEEQFGEILRRMDRLAQQQQTVQRIAAYGPQTATSNAAPPASATITVENQYPGEAQVRINGQPYLVPAFRTIQVPRVPTGAFEYSVEMNGMFLEPPRLETLRSVGYVIRIFQRM